MQSIEVLRPQLPKFDAHGYLVAHVVVVAVPRLLR